MKDYLRKAQENHSSLVEDEDLAVLLEIVEDAVHPKVILEIGVRQGFTFRACVETWNPDIAIGIDKEELQDLPAWNGIPILPDAHYLWGHNSHLPSTLEEVKEILGDRKIDFLFIDGDHSLEGVTKDWEMYKDLVRPGGIVAFHDVLKLIQDEGVNGERVECQLLFNELSKKYKSYLINAAPKDKEKLAFSSGIGLIYM